MRKCRLNLNMLNVRLLLKKAKKLLNEGDFSASEEIYKSILKTYPKNKSAVEGLSILYDASPNFSQDSNSNNTIEETNTEISSLLASYGFNDDLTREEWSNIFSYHEAKNFSGLQAYISELLLKKSSLSILHDMAAAIYYDFSEFEKAIRLYRRSLILDPKSYSANLGIAQAMVSLGHFEEARGHLEVAIELNPSSLKALKYLGATFASLGKLVEAESIFLRAIESDPKAEHSYIQLAKLLQKQNKWTESLTILGKAQNKIGNTEMILRTLIIAFIKLERIDEAFEYLDKLLAEHPKLISFLSMRASLSSYMPEVTPKEQLELAEACAGALEINARDVYRNWSRSHARRALKVGFVSGDLYDQVVGRMLLRLLPHLDRSKFELVAFSTSDREDEITQKLRKEFSSWIPIKDRHEYRQSAQQIFFEAPDILIDLSGHMENNALPVFALKPAPLQISWLGYFGTTGIGAIDYKLVDPYVVPDAMEQFFKEEIFRLPDCFLCPSIPEELDYTYGTNYRFRSGVLFGSVNRFNKITNSIIRSWSEILNAVPDSQMLLKGRGGDNGEVGQRILKQFNAQGIKAERLIFQDRSNLGDYLKVLSEVDIVLDTFPFTGGVTTTDALWLGTPVLGRIGRDTLVSYQGESILRNANMEDWIAKNEDDYIKKAISVASDSEQLSALRRGEETRSIKKSPLFDINRFAKNFECALLEMWDRRASKDFG